MKKILLVISTLLLTPTISACQDKAHSIVCINKLTENYTIDLSLDQFKRLVDNKQSFAIEFYSPYCTHCEELNPKLLQYGNETGHLIYKLDMTKIESEEEFAKWQANYPDIFADRYVPAIRFIKNGQLTFEVNSKKFESYTALKNIMDKHFLKSTVTMVPNITTFDNYRNNHEDFMFFVYDLVNDKSIELTTNYLVKEGIKENILLLNKTDFAANFGEIKTFFNTDLDNFIGVYIDKEITKIGDYTATDFNFDNFISA